MPRTVFSLCRKIRATLCATEIWRYSTRFRGLCKDCKGLVHAAHFWGGNRLTGSKCQLRLNLFGGFGRGAGQGQGLPLPRPRRSLIWGRRDGPQTQTAVASGEWLVVRNCRGGGRRPTTRLAGDAHTRSRLPRWLRRQAGNAHVRRPHDGRQLH